MRVQGSILSKYFERTNTCDGFFNNYNKTNQNEQYKYNTAKLTTLNALNFKNNQKTQYNQNQVNFISFKKHFHQLTKSDFDGADIAIIERYKPNIQHFKKKEDLQNFAKLKINELKEKNLTGRHEETKAHRIKILKEWFDYVTEDNEAYSNTQQLIILNSITKNLKPSNDLLPPILNKGTLADTMTELTIKLKNNPKTNFDFNKMYQNNLRITYTKNPSYCNKNNRWIIIPSKINDSENFENNVEKLKALSHKNWCTKSFNARPYLSKGDFHIYIENDQPKIGIKFINDEIDEIQGEKNNSQIPIKYINLINKYYIENNFKLSQEVKKSINNTLKRKEQLEKIKKNIGKSFEINSTKDTEKILNLLGKNTQISKNNLIIVDDYSFNKTDLTPEDLELNENKIFQFVEEIKGDANFTHSNVTNLGNLKYIRGNVSFTESQIENLGNLEYIGKNANFVNSPIKNLNKLKYIGNTATFTDSKIKNLNNLEFIGNNAYFLCSSVEDLGQLKTIRGNACILGSNLTMDDFKNVRVLGNFEF